MSASNMKTGTFLGIPTRDLPHRGLDLLTKLYVLIRKYLWVWVVIFTAAALFQKYYFLGFNTTYSLPQTCFLIKKGGFVPQRGDYMTFRWNGGGPYKTGTYFTKIVAGIPGDVVTRKGRDFYVNGKFVGTAKTHSRMGEPLKAGKTGVLGEGEYYVMTPHPDSLDSRYAMTGWIKQEAIIGKAHAVF
ncbi:MAG: S26 family signal peptidase [Sulfuricaulis sp.]